MRMISQATAWRKTRTLNIAAPLVPIERLGED
jgi:hypothetical protein